MASLSPSLTLEAFNNRLQDMDRNALLITVAAGCFALLACNLVYSYITAPKKRPWKEMRVAGTGEGGKGYRGAMMRYIKDARGLLLETMEKHGENKIFWVPALIGPIITLPRSYLQDIKNSPDLNFAEYLRHAVCGEETGLDAPFRNPSFIGVVRKNVTQTLNHITAALSEETTTALETVLPVTQDWTPHGVHEFMGKLVSRVSTRVFLGVPACRDERWLNLTREFAEHVHLAGITLRFYPAFVRKYIISPFGLNAHLRKARAGYANAHLIIGELVTKRRAEIAAGGQNYQKPNDALQWAMDAGEPDEKLADFQLFLTGVALHTTTAALTQLIFDLCMHPEYIPRLRKEIADVIGDDVNGMFDAKSELFQLKLLDSFMKESQRLNPIQNITIQRKATDDVRLHDGFVIRKGEFVQVSSSPTLRDPRIYPDPDRFDGDRFLRMTQQGTGAHSAQYVSVSENFFAFGYGSHACPGRFFAANEIKIIIVYMIMRYDFMLPEGTKERPENHCFEDHIMPNLTQKVLFRKRRVDGK